MEEREVKVQNQIFVWLKLMGWFVGTKISNNTTS